MNEKGMNCQHCNRPITKPRHNQKFCSDSCRVSNFQLAHPEKYKNNRNTFQGTVCKHCEGVFTKHHQRQEYCNEFCKNAAYRVRRRDREDQAQRRG